MTLQDEFSKLGKSKSIIRRAIQENGGNITPISNLSVYSTAIDDFSDVVSVDETNEDEYCRNSITQLVLTVTKIRDYAFYENTSLKELVLNVTEVIPFGRNAFKGTHFETDGIIYVPDNLFYAYTHDENWYRFNIRKASEFVADPKHLHPLESLDRYMKLKDLQNFTLNEIQAK